MVSQRPYFHCYKIIFKNERERERERERDRQTERVKFYVYKCVAVKTSIRWMYRLQKIVYLAHAGFHCQAMIRVMNVADLD